jgi:hypothetical protein
LAVVTNPQDQNEQQPGQVPGSVQLSSNQGGSAAGAATVVPVGQPKGSGSRFTNIKQYLGANQGAGQRVAGQIEKQADRAVSGQRKEADQQINQVRAGIQSEQQRLAQAGNVAQTISQGNTSDIQNLAQNQLQDVTALRTGQNQYDPLSQTTQQALGSLQNVADAYGQTAQAAGTEQGRFGLLRNAISGPNYTGGQRRLDQLLLQGSGKEALGTLQGNLRSQADLQAKTLAEQQAALNPALSGIKTQAQEAQDQILQALGSYQDKSGALGSLNQQLEEARLAAIQKQDADLAAAQERISTGNLTDRELNLLGLQPDRRIFDVNLNEYSPLIQRGDIDITQADIANADQMARLSALQQLAGLNENSINLGNKAGTIGPIFQGKEALSARLQEKDTDYQKLQNDIINSLDGFRNSFKVKRDKFGGGGTYTQDLWKSGSDYAKAFNDLKNQGYSDEAFQRLVNSTNYEGTAMGELFKKFNTLNPNNFAVNPTQMGQVE